MRTRSHALAAIPLAGLLALSPLASAMPALAQSSDAGEVERGAADPTSVLITLGGQATEIRQALMEGGEPNADGLAAAERAREIATQAVEATGILTEGIEDTQVTTTRNSDVETAREAFMRMSELLELRIAAITAGDEAEANRTRLAVIDAINELPDSVRFDGNAASGDSPTAAPGGAQPVIQQ